MCSWIWHTFVSEKVARNPTTKVKYLVSKRLEMGRHICENCTLILSFLSCFSSDLTSNIWLNATWKMLQNNRESKSCEMLLFVSKKVSNNVVTSQSSIVLILSHQTILSHTEFGSTHSISSHQTILWHHKVWLYSFCFFPANNVVTSPCSMVLILFLSIKQCCDITKFDCTHSISSHQTMFWHHKTWLYSFNFFPFNNGVTPQSLIVLILFLPIKQCCDITKIDFTDCSGLRAIVQSQQFLVSSGDTNQNLVKLSSHTLESRHRCIEYFKRPCTWHHVGIHFTLIFLFVRMVTFLSPCQPPWRKEGGDNRLLPDTSDFLGMACHVWFNNKKTWCHPLLMHKETVTY